MRNWREKLLEKVNYQYFNKNSEEIENAFESIIKELNEENGSDIFEIENIYDEGIDDDEKKNKKKRVVKFYYNKIEMRIYLIVKKKSIKLQLCKFKKEEEIEAKVRFNIEDIDSEYGLFQKYLLLPLEDDEEKWQDINLSEGCAVNKYSKDYKKILNILMEEVLSEWVIE